MLAGGVGAARFLTGLVKIIEEEKINIIVNTGDDICLHGLYISPDIDIVTYTLANIVNENIGWGIKDDTFHSLEMLRQLGHLTWFKLGDKDLGTHIYRTELIKKGFKLSEITTKICSALKLKVRIIPVTNNKLQTMILTNNKWIHFQEYLVKRGAKDIVNRVNFVGAKNAKPAPEVLASIYNAEGIIICPSNPIVSINPILSVKGVRKALINTKAKKVGISPIVSGEPIKGPAGKIMRGLGLEVSAFTVANMYKDFLDTFIIDKLDYLKEKKIINELDLSVKVTNTIMDSLKNKINLAKVTLEEINKPV